MFLIHANHSTAHMIALFEFSFILEVYTQLSQVYTASCAFFSLHHHHRLRTGLVLLLLLCYLHAPLGIGKNLTLLAFIIVTMKIIPHDA